jgi:hypothetical protein
MPQLRVSVSFPGLTAPRFFDRVVNSEGLSIDHLQAAVDESVQAFNAKFTEALERMRPKEATPERAA